MLIKPRKILTACLLVASTSTSFANDFWMEIGKAPSNYGNATSVALGLKFSQNWAVKYGLTNDQNFSSAYLDYPVPHNNYVNLGVKKTKNTWGLDFDYFFPTESALKPYIGTGLYFGSEKNIAQSNATGWYYNQGDATNMKIAGEAGVQYKTEAGFRFGAGYHTIRGGYLSIGKEF